MKHKKLMLIIINCILCAILICIFCVNSFAYLYNSMDITLVDIASSTSRNISIPINENVSTITFVLDPDDCCLYVSLGVHDATTTFFITYVPSTFQVDVSVNAGQTQITPYNMTYAGNSSASWSLDTNVNNYTIYVLLEMYSTSNAIYTQQQYQAYGTSRYSAGYSAGQSSVTSDPSHYDLYSQAQYDEYGRYNYSSGYDIGYRDGQLASSNDYAFGYQEGQKDGKTLVGLANVFLSNAYNFFISFVNSTGVFGISLITIITTALIILIVWLIFKAVKS